MLSIAADATGLVLVLWSISLGAWFFADTSGPAEQVTLAVTVRGIIGISLAITAVILGWSLVDGARRLWRTRELAGRGG